MEPEYIQSRQNPLMVRTAKLLSSRKHRRAAGMFAGEGRKLLEEAVKWRPNELYAVIQKEELPWPELPDHVRRISVPGSLMDRLSELETPEGVLFLMRALPETDARPVPGTIVLDGVQDPGNLGTILRTADALDVPALLTEGCADPFAPKTVRASMGSVLRTPPGTISRENLIQTCGEDRLPLWATALSDSARDLRRTPLRSGVVVIGSEGRGVSRQLLDAADGHLIIPMHPRCESLNAAAAAAIVLWQMTAL